MNAKQARLILESASIGEILDQDSEEYELLKENNPELLGAYEALEDLASQEIKTITPETAAELDRLKAVNADLVAYFEYILDRIQQGASIAESEIRESRISLAKAKEVKP